MNLKQNLVDIYNLIISIHVSGEDVDRVFIIKKKILEILQTEEKETKNEQN